MLVLVLGLGLGLGLLGASRGLKRSYATSNHVALHNVFSCCILGNALVLKDDICSGPYRPADARIVRRFFCCCPYRPADVRTVRRLFFVARIVRPMSVSSGGCPYLAADACYIDSNTWYIQYSIFKQKALVCKGQRGGVIIERSTVQSLDPRWQG